MGLDVTGLEIDPYACQTRHAYGLKTVQGDVRKFGPGDFSTAGLIASPPCQTFSRAGKGSGRAAFDELQLGIKAVAARQIVASIFEDERTGLVLEPLRWALEALDWGRTYQWLAFEQVPSVIAVWEEMAKVLRVEGYHVATGLVHAEQYGVPQTRTRAVLIAHRDKPVSLPTPTHSRFHNRTPSRLDTGVQPWVSMAEALGWGQAAPSRREAVEQIMTGEITPGVARMNNQSGTKFDLGWPLDRPAPVIAGRDLVTMPGANANRFNGATKSRNDGIRITQAEAAILQSFPVDYPWQGNKSQQFKQIGNAVPPLLAEAILAQV